MLANTLVTNEIKNSAGVEAEFQRLSTGDSRSEFALIGESPAFPSRMTISHQESGTGINRRRRSVIRFDRTLAGAVDNTKTYRNSAYVVLDRGIGHEVADTNAKDTLAYLISVLASTGADTVVKFDCTGTGASNLISRGI
jgi:hypothetical protein